MLVLLVIYFLARSKGHYRLVGLILAWSLVHGGPGGNFLSRTLYNSIAFGSLHAEVDMKDIPNGHFREELSKVQVVYFCLQLLCFVVIVIFLLQYLFCSKCIVDSEGLPFSQCMTYFSQYTVHLG